jgi:hypothetical protein
MSSIRALLTIAAVNDLEVHQMDVKTVFLNGVLEEELYMDQPEGFIEKEKEDYVCKLQKGLYGLKQAPRAWSQAFQDFIQKMNFKSSNGDECINYYLSKDKTEVVLLSIYVDDLLLASNNIELLNALKEKLMQGFKMTDIGELDYYKIERDREKRLMYLSQSLYIEQTLSRFPMTECKPVSTPPDVHAILKPEESMDMTVQNQFRGIVGTLMYLMTPTRPDIAMAVGYLRRFVSCNGQAHLQAAKRV